MLQPYRDLQHDSTTINPPMTTDYYPTPQGGTGNIQPSLAVVLGILTIMFSLTFALLLYAKCCSRDPTAPVTPLNRHRSSIFSSPALIDSNNSSGLDKKAIESLPFFRFGTLRGSKDGLECAVCLSNFEDTEILRLLPKCRHAFHIDCVDRWLTGNSTCPLCRSSVEAEDASLLNTSSSEEDTNSTGLNQSSSANEGLELFVEREEEETGDINQDRVVCRSSSIFSIGTSFRKFISGDGGFPVSGSRSGGGNIEKALHKHNHKIVVSDLVFKNRWSNVSSSDLLFLKSEMMLSSQLGFSLSGRLNGDLSACAAATENIQSIREEMEGKRRALLNYSSGGCGRDSPAMEGRRSMSEITILSRFRGWRNFKGREDPVTGGIGVVEKKRKIWLPIARNTVEWFASREETKCSRNGRVWLQCSSILTAGCSSIDLNP